MNMPAVSANTHDDAVQWTVPSTTPMHMPVNASNDDNILYVIACFTVTPERSSTAKSPATVTSSCALVVVRQRIAVFMILLRMVIK